MNGAPLLPSVVKLLLRRSFGIQTNCKLRLSEPHSRDDPRPGVTHPYQAPHSALFTLPIPPSSSHSLFFSPLLSSIHQQSCTPTSRHPHGKKCTNTHMQTLILHTFMHSLASFSLYFPDETFVNYKHYQSMRKTGCTSFLIKFKDNACLLQSFTESYMV